VNSLSTELASLPEFVPATVKHLQPVSVELMKRDSTRTPNRCLLKTRRAIMEERQRLNITPKKQKNRYGRLGVIQEMRSKVQIADAPTFISTEGNELVLPLSCSGTIIKAPTRASTDRELNECQHIAFSSNRDWDPQNARLPKVSRYRCQEIRATGSSMRRWAKKTLDARLELLRTGTRRAMTSSSVLSKDSVQSKMSCEPENVTR
jgi:hypothetical protein